MEPILVPLHDLQDAALEALAGLHCAVMHTLLADLGRPIVLRFYEAARTEKTSLGLCAFSPGGDLLGWAQGSPDPAALNARLRQPPDWFAGQMLRVLLTRPSALLGLARSVLSPGAANLLKPGQVELTYIGVAAASQGQGLGRALLAGFTAQARAAGYTSIALSVETDNIPATALYTRAGFRITRTFSEGRFSRHRMEYSIH